MESHPAAVPTYVSSPPSTSSGVVQTSVVLDGLDPKTFQLFSEKYKTNQICQKKIRLNSTIE